MPDKASIATKLTNYLLWVSERGFTTARSLRAFGQRHGSSHRRKVIFLLEPELGSEDEKTLLARIIAAMKFAPSDFAIMTAGDFYQDSQLNPSVVAELVIAMGAAAGALVAGRSVEIEHEGGLLQQSAINGADFIVTLHPSEMIRDPRSKVKCWEHLQKALAHIESIECQRTLVQ